MFSKSTTCLQVASATLALLLVTTGCSNDTTSRIAGLGTSAIFLELDSRSLRRISYIVRGSTLAVTNLFGVEFKLIAPDGARLARHTSSPPPSSLPFRRNQTSPWALRPKH